jgi:nitronate monooxygenase
MARDPLTTPLCDLLGIRVAILLAPMANGPSTPELAGAVSRAGGLGCLGVTGLTREVVDQQVRRARELAGGGPIAVNVQIGPSRSAQVSADELDEYLRPLRRELGIGDGEGGGAPAADPPVALLEAALDAGASAVSVALGDPAEVTELARAAGVPLIASASSVAEARQAVASGADVVVAQGAEGGGHRTTFDVDAAPLPLVGTFVLVPRVVDAVDVPVAAAGGIMDGRGVAAALALGAQGAWVGTRFMQAEEAGTAPAHQQALAALADTDTLVTDSVTGRPARWIRNRVVETFEQAPGHLGWPGQAAAVGPIRRAAASGADPQLLPMLAGQGAGMVSELKPAEAIVEELAHDARDVLARLSPPPPPLA